MYYFTDECALDDERILLLALHLGITHGDAFLACSRVWCWLYKRGAGVIPPEEVDVIGRRQGLAVQLVACDLADATPEGLRIHGEKRAARYAKFIDQQKLKSKAGVEARWSTPVVSNTNGCPGASPGVNPGINPDLFSLRSSDQSDQSPESDSSAQVARDRQAQKRIQAREAAEAWVEWFNRRFARSFRVTQELSKQVGALLTKGYSEKPDMRGVALYLRSRWEDDEKMAQYLVPSTILRPSKFAERLDLAREWDKQASTGIWGST